MSGEIRKLIDIDETRNIKYRAKLKSKEIYYVTGPFTKEMRSINSMRGDGGWVDLPKGWVILTDSKGRRSGISLSNLHKHYDRIEEDTAINKAIIECQSKTLTSD